MWLRAYSMLLQKCPRGTAMAEWAQGGCSVHIPAKRRPRRPALGLWHPAVAQLRALAAGKPRARAPAAARARGGESTGGPDR